MWIWMHFCCCRTKGQLDSGKPNYWWFAGPEGVVPQPPMKHEDMDHSAMPMAEAYRRCPRNFTPEYGKISGRSKEVLRFYNFSPIVEIVSIDEAFLVLPVVKGPGSAEEIGWNIKQIAKRLRLTASVGIYNKFLAKLASDLDKPDGFGDRSEKALSVWTDCW